MIKQKILDAYEANPEMEVVDIAKMVGASVSYSFEIVSRAGRKSSAQPLEVHMEQLGDKLLSEVVEHIEAELEFDLSFNQMRSEVMEKFGVPHRVYRYLFYNKVCYRQRSSWRKRRRKGISRLPSQR